MLHRINYWQVSSGKAQCEVLTASAKWTHAKFCFSRVICMTRYRLLEVLPWPVIDLKVNKRWVVIVSRTDLILWLHSLGVQEPIVHV